MSQPRNPKNQIKSDLYTSGGELIIASSGVDYIGYYHVINNQAFAGKKQGEFATEIILDVAPELVPAGTQSNFLSDIGNTVGFFTDAYAFAKSNLEAAKSIADKYIPSKSLKTNTLREGIHYFSQNKLDADKIIKEILSSDVSLSSLQKDPTYIIVQIDFSSPDVDKQIEEGNKQIPGLKTFVNL
jgi:hypothetical protein